ncbi:MAG: hypothetical protein JOY53_11305 [Acidobacteriaceae bacterium]|nr:hypothetical protein [Acidobacteriaceae bacterium]
MIQIAGDVMLQMSGLVLGLLTAALFVLGVYPGPLWKAISAAAAGLG